MTIPLASSRPTRCGARPPAPLAALAALALLVVLLLALPAGAPGQRDRPARRRRRRPWRLSCAGEDAAAAASAAPPSGSAPGSMPASTLSHKPKKTARKPAVPPVELVPAACEDGNAAEPRGRRPLLLRRRLRARPAKTARSSAPPRRAHRCARSSRPGNSNAAANRTGNARRSNSPAKTRATEMSGELRTPERTGSAPKKQNEGSRTGFSGAAGPTAAASGCSPHQRRRGDALVAGALRLQVRAVEHDLLGREARARASAASGPAPPGADAGARDRHVRAEAPRRLQPGDRAQRRGEIALQLRPARRRGRAPRPPARAGAAAAATPARPSRARRRARDRRTRRAPRRARRSPRTGRSPRKISVTCSDSAASTPRRPLAAFAQRAARPAPQLLADLGRRVERHEQPGCGRAGHGWRC